jgi:hypothetical protein
MPNIPAYVIRSAFYLHNSEDDAKNGRDSMGTGFFIKLEEGSFNHVYAVANWHVVFEGNAPFIRYLAADNGEQLQISKSNADWESPSGCGDIAVTHIVSLSRADGDARQSAIPLDEFVTEEDIAELNVGVGDDVFMVGMYEDHGAEAHMIPAARFGNISMLPSIHAPMEEMNSQHRMPCFVMDMRSRSGFSGSPVFAFRTWGSDLHFDPSHHVRIYQDSSGNYRLHLDEEPMFKLAGLHIGQFNEEVTIISKEQAGSQMVLGSAMTQVIPAWRIRDFLNGQRFADARKVFQAAALKKIETPTIVV